MQVLRVNVLSRGFTYQLQSLTSSARQKKECIVLTLVYLELYRPQRVMFFLYIFQPVVAVLGGNTRALFRAKGKVTGKH